jgi:PKD repeat protein
VAGVYAPASRGDWTARNATVDSVVVGVYAPASRGDWTVRDGTVANASTAPDVPDPAAGTLVYAANTTGAWAVHGTVLVGAERAAVNATGAALRGNATANWWGDPAGPAPGDCVGNVTCADPLAAQPGGPLFEAPLPGTGGEGPPTDPDGDGRYEDVDGSGTADFDDAVALAFADASGLTGAQRAALDFDSDGDVDFDDAVSLAFQV